MTERLMDRVDQRMATTAMRLDEPLEFESTLRPQVWGGEQIARLLGKSAATTEPIGEAWDVSALSEHPSRVSGGRFFAQSLPTLWEDFRHDILGSCRPTHEFPLLIKWLDCQGLLSVQVHPSDRLARDLLNQPSGKSEAWVVVHAEPTSRVYAGLKSGVTPDEFRARLAAGTVAECLHSFVPRVGDCISLPAGTIHSAGGGVVFAEVQQPSDTTFRIFDWNRLGLDGKPRTLHTGMALRAITWPQPPINPIVPRALSARGSTRGELLLQSPCFTLERYTVTGDLSNPHPGQMSIWMVLEGTAHLSSPSTERDFPCGSTVLIPAATRASRWSATEAHPCVLLCVRPATCGDSSAP